MATLNFGFGGEDGDGIYHSIYDNFEHFTRWSDTSFVYGRALAQTGGIAMLRLANAELLPFEFGSLSSTVDTYADEVKALLVSRREAATERNRQLDDGVFKALTDPQNPEAPPGRADVAPALNFAPLDNALAELRAERRSIRRRVRRLQRPRAASSPRRTRSCCGWSAPFRHPKACCGEAGIATCSTRRASTPGTG